MHDLYSIFLRRSEGIKPGLERIREAWQLLGPHNTACVLVGGTNGKGSTSGMLWHLLSAANCPAGLFTSPHLRFFSERIQVSHAPVDDNFLARKFAELGQRLGAQVEAELSFFEVATLLARLTFEEKKTRLNVWEVGLGGRWDATNINEPLCSVVTSIDLDHQKWLGGTVAEICAEKVPIARSGCPLFWGELRESVNAQVMPVVLAKKQEIGFTLIRVGEHFGLAPDGLTYTLKLPGLPSYQGELPAWFKQRPRILQENFVIAAAMFYYLLHRHGATVLGKEAQNPSEVFAASVERFFAPELPWPPSLLGRFQSMELAHCQRPFLVDVCHNPASATRLQESLKALRSKVPMPGLVSILADKDINAILDLLRAVLDPIVLFRSEGERAMSYSQLEARHRDLIQSEDFASALSALDGITDKGEEAVVCGSLLAVGQVLSKYEVLPVRRGDEWLLLGR